MGTSRYNLYPGYSGIKAFTNKMFEMFHGFSVYFQAEKFIVQTRN